MAVRKSRRKVIGVQAGYRKTVAARAGSRKASRTMAKGWFGDWHDWTPPWWATRRAHEIKRRKGK